MTDDDLPRPKLKPHESGQDLSLLSVKELVKYIALPRSETARGAVLFYLVSSNPFIHKALKEYVF
jgi:hypothetical protein